MISVAETPKLQEAEIAEPSASARASYVWPAYFLTGVCILLCAVKVLTRPWAPWMKFSAPAWDLATTPNWGRGISAWFRFLGVCPPLLIGDMYPAARDRLYTAYILGAVALTAIIVARQLALRLAPILLVF